MINYVNGFMFNRKVDPNEVLLISKNHPEWQAGKLNGVGGKIQDGESPNSAMVREFAEEVGIATCEEEWILFCILEGTDFKVYFFKSHGEIRHAKKMETERPVPVWMEDLWTEPLIYNLRWLVPLALDQGIICPVTIKHK